MCLIAFAWRAHPRYPLVIAANRDEFYARPSTALASWREDAGAIGGRDLRAGGSWLAAHAGGRLGAVTNVRPGGGDAGESSRGLLVRDFVLNDDLSASFAEDVLLSQARYGGFNLLLHDGEELIWVTNRPKPAWKSVMPGIHALSNGAPSFVPGQKPWPKVTLSIAVLGEWIRTIPAAGEPDLLPLFALLSNEDPVNDKLLPDTGIGVDSERILAPPFIRTATYGTRASTVVLVSVDGDVTMIERRFSAGGHPGGETRLALPSSRSPQSQSSVNR